MDGNDANGSPAAGGKMAPVKKGKKSKKDKKEDLDDLKKEVDMVRLMFNVNTVIVRTVYIVYCPMYF